MMARLGGRVGAWTLAVAVAVAALYALWQGRARPPELPAIGAAREATSVSGLSSGAYMAGQLHFARSRSIVGAGLVAGGPYACADSASLHLLPWPAGVAQSLSRALRRCLGRARQVPDAGALAERARRLAAAGEIDPLDGLVGDRVYLFHGGGDTVIGRALVQAAGEVYRLAGVAEADVSFATHASAGHGLLTKGAGGACHATQPPFLNDCGFDQAGAILAHIHGPLRPPSATREGSFVLFEQGPFVEARVPHGLDRQGVLYLPDACRARPGCRVHVVFHGCGQGREAVGEAFVRGSGYAAHADRNRIAVLFPQVAAGPANPRGCWDWWGYSAPDFLSRQAPQLAAVWRMVERLAETP